MKTVCQFAAVIALFMLSACTFVPFETERLERQAQPPSPSAVSQLTTLLGEEPAEDKLLLAPLSDGNDALGARLRMIDEAESSIDIQTFLIKPDIAGGLIWLALYEAAERGVSIRILYDDVFTSATDAQLATLNTHPNVDIRTFNPLSRNSTKAMNFLLDFQRVNRRMHNKAFIVDGTYAIVGGRNLADEYFQIDTKTDFADFDMFVAGPPVTQLSHAFDLFWNDQWSLPLERLTVGDPKAISVALDNFRANANSPGAKIYQRAVQSEYLRGLRTGENRSYLGTSRVIFDAPEKLRIPPGQEPFDIGNAFYNSLLKADREVLIITPYFVPEDYGAEVFEALVARGIRVRIFTNSLASTNHPYVHGGYAKYRNRLLKSGVEFFEVRADAPELVEGSDAQLVLHTKLAVVDGDTLFVSSTNIDPRSIRQNSEIGMLIESPELAYQLLSRFDANIGDYVFSVAATPEGKTVWRYSGTGVTEEYDSEPNASFLRRLVSVVSGWLPIEQQL